MRSHHISLFIALGGCWSSPLISINFAHVPHCVHFLDIHAVDLFNILLYFWLGEPLVYFEHQNIIIYFYTWPLEQDLMIDKAIVRVLFGEITIFRSLTITYFTSRPYGFRK